MESTTAPLARTAPTDGLPELLDRGGPFLTVVLDTDPAIDNAAHRSAQRWRALRDEAAAAGAPAELLDGVDDLVTDAHLQGPALYVVVDAEAGEPVVVEHLSALPSTGEHAWWAPYPAVVPLLADRQRRLPHVVVRCDREGADVLAVDADGRTDETTVSDDNRPYRHARSVGWQELRGWHRARRHLEATAEGVANAAADAARQIDARLVVVTGDDRTVDEVVTQLVARDLDARPVAGGRGQDGSEARVDEEVDVLVRTVVKEHEVAALRRFKDQRGQDLAVEGVDDTLAALSTGRIDVLLVRDGEDDETIAEAIRGALASSASIVVVPAHGGPADGVGGLLRWR